MAKLIQMPLNEREIVKYQKLNESESGKLFDGVLCRVKYPIYWFGQLNRNNRMYEEAIMDKLEGDKEIKEAIEKRSSFMQEEHPLLDNKTRTAHIAGVLVGFTRESVDGKKAGFAVMDVLDTPMGRIVDTLIRANCGIGTSTRADGAVEECMDEGTKKPYHRVITESYKFFALDFTAEPSTYGSYPMDVQRNVVDIVKESVGSGKLDRETALHLLESLSAPEATKLNETIKLCSGKCEGGCKRVATGTCACSEEQEKDIDPKFLYSVAHKKEYNKGTWWYDLATGEIKVGKDAGSKHNDEEFSDIAHKPGWINGRVFEWEGKNILIVYYPDKKVTSSVLLDLDKKLEHELGLKVDYAINHKGEDISNLLESLIERTSIKAYGEQKVNEELQEWEMVDKKTKARVEVFSSQGEAEKSLDKYFKATGRYDNMIRPVKYIEKNESKVREANELTEPQSDAFEDNLVELLAKYPKDFTKEEALQAAKIVHGKLGGEEGDENPDYVLSFLNSLVKEGMLKVSNNVYTWLKESKIYEDINIKVGDMVEVLDSGAVTAPASKVTNTKETLNANGTKTVLVQTEKGGDVWFDATKVKLNKFNESLRKSKAWTNAYASLVNLEDELSSIPGIESIEEIWAGWKAFKDRIKEKGLYESKLNEDADKEFMNKLFKEAHAYFDKMKIQPDEDDIMDYVVQAVAGEKGLSYENAMKFVEQYCGYDECNETGAGMSREEKIASLRQIIKDNRRLAELEKKTNPELTKEFTAHADRVEKSLQQLIGSNESIKKGDKLEMNVKGTTVKAVALSDSSKIGQVEVVKIAQEGNKEPVTVMVGRVKKLGETKLNEAKFLLWDKAAMKVLTKKNGSVLEFNSTMEARKHVEDLLGEPERYEILARTNTSPVQPIQREAAMVGSRESRMNEDEGRYKNNLAGPHEEPKKTEGRFVPKDKRTNPDMVEGNESKLSEATQEEVLKRITKIYDELIAKGLDKNVAIGTAVLRVSKELNQEKNESLNEEFNFDKDLDKFMAMMKGLISEDEVKSLSESKTVSEGVSDLLAKRKHAQALIEAERDKAIEIATMYEHVIVAKEKALREANSEVNYEELAKDLQPKTKEVFVKFMNARWPNSGPKYDAGYAKTWLERFKRGEEWEFSDSQSRDVLKGLGDYAKKEEGKNESEKKALITKVHEELNKVFSAKLSEQKESFEKQIKALNEKHEHEIFQRTIVDRKIEKSGLTLPEPVVALLREAKSEEQVESIIGRYRLDLNEALLHSGKPQGMTVTVEEPGKPTDSVMQASLEKTKQTLRFMK